MILLTCNKRDHNICKLSQVINIRSNMVFWFWRQQGFHNVIFKSDSHQIISTLRESSTNMSYLRHIIEDSKTLLRSIIEASYTHVRHQANNVAHHLARCALRAASPLPVVRFPSWVYSRCAPGGWFFFLNGLSTCSSFVTLFFHGMKVYL